MHWITILGINFRELLNPQFYIEHGGLWMIIFIVFAETGLFAGFFLPGDALLFVTGIYSSDIIDAALGKSHNEWIDLLILWVLITLAGILGNFCRKHRITGVVKTMSPMDEKRMMRNFMTE